MITWLLSGLLLGIGAFLHCAAMCGPIMMATSGMFMQKKGNAFFPLILQLLGKTFTYVCLGVIFGYLGKILNLHILQERLLLVSGIVLIILSIQGWFNILGNSKFATFWNTKIGKAFSGLVKHPFLLGVVHGLIPCGMVYSAAIAAIATHSVAGGMLLMLGFGLGTIPVLLFISLGGRQLFLKLRKYKWVQQLPVLILGIVFFIKGLGLDIQYLSPKIEHAEKGKAECCKDKDLD